MEQVKDKDEIIKDLRAKLELANVTIKKEELEDYFTLKPLPYSIDTSKWKEEFIITNEDWERIKKSIKEGDRNETLA